MFGEVRFSPSGTAGCSHGRESVVLDSMIALSPNGTAGARANQGSDMMHRVGSLFRTIVDSVNYSRRAVLILVTENRQLERPGFCTYS
jgi:hypothetical protein